MNDKCLLIERLVQIEMVEIELDLIDCINVSFPQKITVK